MLSVFPRGVLDEILNLIESVSEDLPSYSSTSRTMTNKTSTVTKLADNDVCLKCTKGYDTMFSRTWRCYLARDFNVLAIRQCDTVR